MKPAFALFAAILFFHVQSCPALQYRSSIGIDLPGEHSFISSNHTTTYDSGAGFNISEEALFPICAKWMLGAGAELQLLRSVMSARLPGAAFHFTPIYGTVRYLPFGASELTVEAIADIGVNYLFGNSDYSGRIWHSPGLYAAIGAGVVMLRDVSVDLRYRLHQARHSIAGVETTVSQRQFTLRIAYMY